MDVEGHGVERQGRHSKVGRIGRARHQHQRTEQGFGGGEEDDGRRFTLS